MTIFASNAGFISFLNKSLQQISSDVTQATQSRQPRACGLPVGSYTGYNPGQKSYGQAEIMTSSQITLCSTLWRVTFTQTHVSPPPLNVASKKCTFSPLIQLWEGERGGGKSKRDDFQRKGAGIPMLLSKIVWVERAKQKCQLITSQGFIMPPNLDWQVFVTLCVYEACNASNASRLWRRCFSFQLVKRLSRVCWLETNISHMWTWTASFLRSL